jgi:hypothetical protein
VSLAAASLLTSCRQQAEEVSPVHKNLGWLGSQYARYVGQNQGQTPKTLEELQKFVQENTSPEELSRLGLADARELFVSPRDGKPFRMVSYAKLPPPAMGEPSPVVLYEEAGQDGKRAVAYLGGGTDELDEATLQKSLPAAKR